MPNPKYIKGRAFEYKIMKELEKDGYTCFRTAGSHSPIDIIAIHMDTGIIQFIQAKNHQYVQGEKALKKIYEAHAKFNRFFFGMFRFLQRTDIIREPKPIQTQDVQTSNT